jgi:hypothetical protein
MVTDFGRYDLDWQPSWKTSRKDFFMTEAGQPTLVDVGNGLHRPTRQCSAAM